MNARNALILTAAAGLFALTNSAFAADKDHSGDEKCFGVAKAGQNDCASGNGAHSCAGQTKTDNNPLDWKYVAKGSCKDMGGTMMAPKKK